MKEIYQDRWQGTGLPLLTEYRVVFDPNRKDIIWLGYSDTGLQLSEDGGKTVINAPLFSRGRSFPRQPKSGDPGLRKQGLLSIAVDPDLSTTIYATISGKNQQPGSLNQ